MIRHLQFQAVLWLLVKRVAKRLIPVIALVIEGNVGSNAIQPSCEFRGWLVCLPSAIDADEHVLCKLFRDRIVVSHPEQKMNNTSTVPL